MNLLLANGAKIPPEIATRYLAPVIERKNTALLELLLENGGDANARVRALLGSSTHSLVEHAVRNKNNDALQLLFQHGATLSQEDANDYLLSAIGDGDLRKMQAFISFGADVNAKDSRRRTPIEKAVSSDNAAALKLLIKHGADVNAHDDTTLPPLVRAIPNHMELAEVLAANGADVNLIFKRIGKDSSLLLYALGIDGSRRGGSGKWQKTLDFLLKHNVEIDLIFPDGTTALARAVKAQNLVAVNFLIQRGADVDHTWTDADGEERTLDSLLPPNEKTIRRKLEAARARKTEEP